MSENAVEQQHPDVAQDNATDEVRHEEHRTEDVGALDGLGQHVCDGERDYVDHDRRDDGQCRREAQRVQELLIGKSPLVVFQTDEFGVGDGGELAEAQIHTHDERDHKPDDERGERWQREERPPLSYRLASHADHSLPAFFPSPFRVPRQRGREFHSPEEPSTALFPVSPVLTSVMINGMTANVKRCHFRMSRTAKYETLSPKTISRERLYSTQCPTTTTL